MKILLLLLMIVSFSYAGTALETNSFATIEKTIKAKVKKYGKQNVLVVLDIDNTVLAATQNLGSDQWFGWQSENCMGKKPLPKFCATDNFGELLRIQGLLFAIMPMKPSDKDTKRVILDTQKMNIKLILLTSRGSDFRNATELSLKANGLRFKESAIGPKGGYASTYTPYTLKHPKKFGLTKSDMKKMGNKSPRPVSYMNGVYMTAGLNKGIMLKSLLHKTGSKFKAIIFADDHIKHTKRMQQILGDVKGLDLTTFRYSKIDPVVKKFNDGKKNGVQRTLKVLKATLIELFGQF